MKIISSVEYFLIEVNQPKIFESNPKTEHDYWDIQPNLEYAGFITINNIDKTQSWSPHFYKALGFFPNEISPSLASLENILHPSDFTILEKIFRNYEQNKNKKILIKTRYKTKMNTYIRFNTSIKAIC
jgi:hypothetical protein